MRHSSLLLTMLGLTRDATWDALLISFARAAFVLLLGCGCLLCVALCRAAFSSFVDAGDLRDVLEICPDSLQSAFQRQI